MKLTPRLITALTIAAGILCSSPMRAQSPASGSDVWFPTGLSHDTCVQRAQAAMRGAGIQDVKVTTPAVGMTWLAGYLGEYAVTVGCITAKDVIVFFGAGPDSAKVTDYLHSIRETMQGRR